MVKNGPFSCILEFWISVMSYVNHAVDLLVSFSFLTSDTKVWTNIIMPRSWRCFCLLRLLFTKRQINFFLLIKSTVSTLSVSASASGVGVGFEPLFDILTEFSGAMVLDDAWTDTLVFVCSWARSISFSSCVMGWFCVSSSSRESLRTRISVVGTDVIPVGIYGKSSALIVGAWPREVDFVVIFFSCW